MGVYLYDKEILKKQKVIIISKLKSHNFDVIMTLFDILIISHNNEGVEKNITIQKIMLM